MARAEIDPTQPQSDTYLPRPLSVAAGRIVDFAGSGRTAGEAMIFSIADPDQLYANNIAFMGLAELTGNPNLAALGYAQLSEFEYGGNPIRKRSERSRVDKRSRGLIDSHAIFRRLFLDPPDEKVLLPTDAINIALGKDTDRIYDNRKMERNRRLVGMLVPLVGAISGGLEVFTQSGGDAKTTASIIMGLSAVWTVDQFRRLKKKNSFVLKAAAALPETVDHSLFPGWFALYDRRTYQTLGSTPTFANNPVYSAQTRSQIEKNRFSQDTSDLIARDIISPSKDKLPSFGDALFRTAVAEGLRSKPGTNAYLPFPDSTSFPELVSSIGRERLNGIKLTKSIPMFQGSKFPKSALVLNIASPAMSRLEHGNAVGRTKAAIDYSFHADADHNLAGTGASAHIFERVFWPLVSERLKNGLHYKYLERAMSREWFNTEHSFFDGINNLPLWTEGLSTVLCAAHNDATGVYGEGWVKEVVAQAENIALDIHDPQHSLFLLQFLGSLEFSKKIAGMFTDSIQNGTNIFDPNLKPLEEGVKNITVAQDYISKNMIDLLLRHPTSLISPPPNARYQISSEGTRMYEAHQDLAYILPMLAQESPVCIQYLIQKIRSLYAASDMHGSRVIPSTGLIDALSAIKVMVRAQVDHTTHPAPQLLDVLAKTCDDSIRLMANDILTNVVTTTEAEMISLPNSLLPNDFLIQAERFVGFSYAALDEEGKLAMIDSLCEHMNAQFEVTPETGLEESQIMQFPTIRDRLGSIGTEMKTKILASLKPIEEISVKNLLATENPVTIASQVPTRIERIAIHLQRLSNVRKESSLKVDRMITQFNEQKKDHFNRSR